MFSELRYINRFRCVGPDCPDHCCKDWRITIDPATERRYRALEGSAFKRDLLASLSRDAGPNGKKETCISLRPDGVCPMFGADGLCRVQAELGEDYLSYTCATFPRLLTGTTREGFRAGTIACPEVAREVLQSPDAMAEIHAAEDMAWHAAPTVRPAKGPTLSLAEMAMVRSCMLQILTETRQPWLGRVTLATLYCNDLGQIDLVRDRGALTTLTMRMYDVLQQADLGGWLGFDAESEALLVKVFIVTLRIITSPEQWMSKRGTSKTELIRVAIAGLQSNGDSLDEVLATFAAIDRDCLRPALDARPQLRGNLFANILLQQNFPIGRPKQAQSALWKATLVATLWRVLLAGQVAHDASRFDDTVLHLTHTLGRLLMHNSKLIDALNDETVRLGLKSDPTIVALLR
jgi:lysine-N-methylase